MDRHPWLYEIPTLGWLRQLPSTQNSPITLGEVPSSQWDRLRELGFGYIWLMGVWKRSPRGRLAALELPQLFPGYQAALPDWMPNDVAGSPYAICAYEVDPLIGDWEDLAKTRNELNRRGMKLILDFVPNHTALDHPWAQQHPEFYVQGTEELVRASPDHLYPVRTVEGTRLLAKGKEPYSLPWQDTLQLNYFHPETRQAMIEELRQIAPFCDGLRCDMAMLVLNSVFARNWSNYVDCSPPEEEFWSLAVREFPDLELIAETYWGTEAQLQELGFAYTYDKEFYDFIASGQSSHLRLHLQKDRAYQERCVRFLENHDEPRSVTRFPSKLLKAATVVFGTAPGMKLVYHGQLQGSQRQLPVQLAKIPCEPVNADIAGLYTKLLELTSAPCFHDGEWKLLSVLAGGGHHLDQVIAYNWSLDSLSYLVVVNLSDEQLDGSLELSEKIAEIKICLGDPLDFTLKDGRFALNRLEPYQAVVLRMSLATQEAARI